MPLDPKPQHPWSDPSSGIPAGAESCVCGSFLASSDIIEAEAFGSETAE